MPISRLMQIHRRRLGKRQGLCAPPCRPPERPRLRGPPGFHVAPGALQRRAFAWRTHSQQSYRRHTMSFVFKPASDHIRLRRGAPDFHACGSRVDGGRVGCRRCHRRCPGAETPFTLLSATRGRHTNHRGLPQRGARLFAEASGQVRLDRQSAYILLRCTRFPARPIVSLFIPLLPCSPRCLP
jgi:hypothetical protein